MFGKVIFLAAARATDKVIVASVSYNGKSIDLGAVRPMLATLTSMKSNQPYNFTNGGHAWSIKEIGGVIYVVRDKLSAPNFPQQKSLWLCFSSLRPKMMPPPCSYPLALSDDCQQAATAEDYPQRVAFQLLDETARLFAARAEDQWKTCREGGLTESTKKILTNLCEKFDNLTAVDKSAGVMAKIDSVKLTMQDNIAAALANSVKMNELDEKANDLQAQAGIFKAQAKSLKDRMWWKNCKMKLAIAGAVITVAGILTVNIKETWGVELLSAPPPHKQRAPRHKGDNWMGVQERCAAEPNGRTEA